MKNPESTRSAGSYRIPTTPTRRPARRSGLLALLLGGALALAAPSCQTVPITGRSAFNLMTPEQDVELGREAYAQILSEEKEVTRGSDLAMVRRVMSDLVAVSDDPGYEWEVKLIDNDQMVNAFALPGGKMAVYTGILPVCGGADGLAVVMGHEIGHVVAQHGTQRMSQAMGVEALFQILDTGQYEELARGAIHYAAELPFGRAHESEADHIGLIYMARAGYDPREAPRFWERMSQLSGDGPPELLSTHPSPETRVSRLKELMPEALGEYQKAGGKP